MSSPTARLVARADLTRLVLGWGAVVVLLFTGDLFAPPVPGPALAAVLAAVVCVIVVASFGVVKQAEALAHRLGDPYGTLVLTLSIVLIEVILIAAVMLGPGEHATIARDSVMAVSMIILNLVIGVSLLAGGLRHGGLTYNRSGTSSYLSMLVVLIALAFALPAAIGDDGAYTSVQAILVTVLTVVLYAFFLYRQVGPQAADFREVTFREVTDRATTDRAAAAEPAVPIGAIVRAHRREILTRLVLLVATVIPIVLLSHDLAELLDDGLGRVGAPVALAGVLIAAIVFLPESLTAVRAARAGEMQRVSNLCHGALVSTVGLTIPAVLVIGLATGQHVILAESPAELLLLGVTLLLSLATFTSRRVTALHGAVHLAAFAVYGIIVFS